MLTGFRPLGPLAVVVALACGGSREPARTHTVTLVPRAPVAPSATLNVALSQPHEAPPVRPSRSSRWTPPAPRPRDAAKARAHFADGVRAYGRGDYAKAVTEFETAYAYAPLPPVLYNIATALEKDGRVSEALDVYELYARSSPPPARSTNVQQKIQILRARSQP